jgi:hypothetical protein
MMILELGQVVDEIWSQWVPGVKKPMEDNPWC